MTRPLQEALFRLRPVRWALAVLFLCKAFCFRALGRHYSALIDFCWIVRVANVGAPGRIASAEVFRVVEAARRQESNPVIEAFRADPACAKLAASYALGGGGPHDLFRDLIVLKTPTATEKG